MYQTVGFCDFQGAFQIRKDSFTYDGLKALYDFLENYEEETGEKIELDVIALCCEYTEYENLKEFQANYGEDYTTIEDVENATTVIKIDDESFIIQDF
ncbi:hypothetical protein LCGC14_2460660 [marine sediment metagenome]|uniref:Uncharacterized protein n=1 Tax=marine sediment metagenome TaxID=412755 RepID=A0A0F9BDZ2_9ZZZZ